RRTRRRALSRSVNVRIATSRDRLPSRPMGVDRRLDASLPHYRQPGASPRVPLRTWPAGSRPVSTSAGRHSGAAWLIVTPAALHGARASRAGRAVPTALPRDEIADGRRTRLIARLAADS